MTALRQSLEDYLAVRRSAGDKLESVARMLSSFVAFAERAGAGTLTTDLALSWATQPQQASPIWLAHRLSAVRGFAAYLHALDPAAEIPPADLLPAPGYQPAPPYLYSDADIAALMSTARALTPALRAATYATLIGLLACTGLRITEALTLRADDVDLQADVLTIRRTKFRKSRLVPLHASAVGPLRTYAADRDHRCGRNPDMAFFVSAAGRRLPYTTVRHTFHGLLRQAMPGVVPVGRVRPRLHDFRHTFVCRRLLAWYREGVDIDRVIDQLSAYLGHVKVSDTYWYLTGAPELLAIAGQRFEQFAACDQGGVP